MFSLVGTIKENERTLIMTTTTTPTDLPSQRALVGAFSAASDVAAPSRQGWIRLAFAASRTNPDKHYVVAARIEQGRIVLGCSCPDWIYRRKATGKACKHQRDLLVPRTRDVSTLNVFPEAQSRLTEAGRVFFQVLQVIGRVRSEQ